MTRVATGWAIFQGLLIEALPFLMLGVTIAGLARWLVPQSAWVRRLPRNPLLAPIVGALLGFALPACECGNVPVARRLLASGAPLGTGFGFLFAKKNTILFFLSAKDPTIGPIIATKKPVMPIVQPQ